MNVPPRKKPTKKHPVAELIDLIVARAPDLHAAGIASLAAGGLHVTLKPPPPPAPSEKDSPPPAPQHIDPLKDPATFPGGRVPGFQREQDAD